MIFSAIQRLTLLDYPGHTACTVFTPGCNFRCHYCHNSEFVLPEKLKNIEGDFIPEEAILSFLRTRKGLLEGVCITGGEPTIHKDLPDFIRKVKVLGFLVKLDTNGSHPEMLKELMDEKLVDFVAMDIKSITNYPAGPSASGGLGAGESRMTNKIDGFCGVVIDWEAIKKSRDLLMNSDIEYEFRTTLVKEFHTDEQFKKLLQSIRGAKHYCLQNFRTTAGCLNPKWETYSGFSDAELEERRRVASKYVGECCVRK